jgi:hypothetical protein
LSGKKSFALRKKTFYHFENSEKFELGAAQSSNIKASDIASFCELIRPKLAISATLPVSFRSPAGLERLSNQAVEPPQGLVCHHNIREKVHQGDSRGTFSRSSPDCRL